MLSWTEVASLVIVGAFWGCTNPLLRKGSTDVSSVSLSMEKNEHHSKKSSIRSLIDQLAKFRYVSVWLPYAVNQTGSLLYYFTLSKSDLSLAVPACNALALVFSIVTSWWILNERVERPFQTVCGAALVVGGVAICASVSTAGDEIQTI